MASPPPPGRPNAKCAGERRARRMRRVVSQEQVFVMRDVCVCVCSRPGKTMRLGKRLLCGAYCVCVYVLPGTHFSGQRAPSHAACAVCCGLGAQNKSRLWAEAGRVSNWISGSTKRGVMVECRCLNIIWHRDKRVSRNWARKGRAGI